MTSGKRGNTAWFINDAIAVHGNKYDYSLVDYRGCRESVTIICPKHGGFRQKPFSHLSGHGCPHCGVDVARTGLFGVGVNNAIGDTNDPANKKWREMIRRCYDKKYFSEKITYAVCSVCDEWLNYEQFKKWFYDPENGYHDGYHLDKDIIVKGNKVYSPGTCCLVPPEINTLITSGKAKRGKNPIGVTFQKGKFIARMSQTTIYNKKQVNLGSFDTAEEAFVAYKAAKENYIKELANSYYRDGKITKTVFSALMRYEISITD